MTKYSSESSWGLLSKVRVEIIEPALLLIFPLFIAGNKFISVCCFSFYVLSKLLRNRMLVASKIRNHLFSFFVICITAFYIILRTSFDAASLRHMLTDSTMYPVTSLDYLVVLLAPLALSTLPITTLEMLSLAMGITLAAIFHIFVGLYFEDGFEFFVVRNWPPIFQIHPGWPDRARLTAGFVNPNILAFFAVLSALTSMGLCKIALTTRIFKPSQWINRWRSFSVALLGFLGLISSCLLIIWSGSRTSLGVFFLSIGLAAAFYRSMVVKSAFFIFAVLLGLQLSGKLKQIGITLSGRVFDRLTAMIGNVRETEGERFKIFSCFWDEALKNPLFGQGIANSTINCEKLANYPPYGFNHGHNILLHTASELGFPATFVIIGSVLWLVYRGTKIVFGTRIQSSANRDLRIGFLLASVACIAMSLTSLAMFHWYPLLLMFCLALAFVSAPVSANEDNASPAP